MAKHKAPTSITIASTTDRTALHTFVEENWKTAAIVAFLVTVVVLGRQWLSHRSAASAGASWDRLRETVPFVHPTTPAAQYRFAIADSAQFPAASELAALAGEVQDSPAGPWAKVLEIEKLFRDGDQEAATAAVRDLEQLWPGHPVVAQPFPFDEESDPLPLAAFLDRRTQAITAWEAAHPLLFHNPPPPEGSPRVRLQTTAGDIVVGLYSDEAPQHVANFLKLCQEGFYVGTKFHRVLPGRLIQGGDPNTIEGDPATWGQGGPDYKIAPERNGLRHFRHVLAMAKQGSDPESSGSQFYITFTPQHGFDDTYVVFGAVLEGGSIVDSIASAPLSEGDRPQQPVAIEATEVLQG
ncbi:MAG: peptidylprolyl isomerase [Planctomycetota bacterium]